VPQGLKPEVFSIIYGPTKEAAEKLDRKGTGSAVPKNLMRQSEIYRNLGYLFASIFQMTRRAFLPVRGRRGGLQAHGSSGYIFEQSGS
jgi:hypothetical protein